MNRQILREMAASALSALSIFAVTYEAPRRQFAGASPVAVVSSRGLVVVRNTRGGGVETSNQLQVAIYVAAPTGGEDAAEDALDTLTAAAVGALMSAGFDVDTSDAQPGGATWRRVDGVEYRVERILIRYEEYS